MPVTYCLPQDFIIMRRNQQIILKAIPQGLPRIEDFAVRDIAALPLGAVQVRLETIALSMDPYMRGQMSGRHLSGALAIGDVLRGEAVSRVTESNSPAFHVGDIVRAFTGWQTTAVMDAAAIFPIGFEELPPSLALGVLGMPGLTAYAGLTRLGMPKPGDRFLVSSAAGTVGASVGQIARLMGCKTVGIAGAAHKCAWLKQHARFDDTIDYKQEDISAGILRACPAKAPPLGGIDIYFDNVGGDTLVAAQENMAHGARVILCGLMDQYNKSALPVGPNPALIIKARAHVHGMVVYDHEDLRDEMIQKISHWIKSGDFIYHEDNTQGLENAPLAFVKLMRGDTFGKVIVTI
jgi:NADPH-dependent curcumin reductase